MKAKPPVKKAPSKGITTRTVKPKAPPIDKVTTVKVQNRNSLNAVVAEVTRRAGPGNYNTLLKVTRGEKFKELGDVTLIEAIERIARKEYDESMWFNIWNAVETFFEKQDYAKKVKAREARAAKRV